MEGSPLNQRENIQEDKLVLVGNILQVQLATRHGETFDYFLEHHADDFRKTMDAHPELFVQFETDEEKTLKEIEERIYH